MRKSSISFSCQDRRSLLKKGTAWVLTMALSLSSITVMPQTASTADAADAADAGITTMLTDSVQVKIGDETKTMKLYNKGVYECEASLKAGDTDAKLLINGKEMGEDNVSLAQDGDVIFRLAGGKFIDSKDDEFVKTAALVGNFAGIEFTNDSDRKDVTLTAGKEEEKRYDIAAWNPANSNAELDYVGGGIFSRTFTFKKLAEDVTIADGGYKVAANDGWDVSWGEGSGNIELTIPAGTSSMTVWADTANGIVYDSIRAKDYSIASGGDKITLTPFTDDTVSLIGTVRQKEDDDWNQAAEGYEFTQISDKYYIYQQKFKAGGYEYKTVYNHEKWSDFSNIKLSVKNDDTNVIFLYDAEADKLYDSLNNATDMGGLLEMSTEAAKQEVISNKNDTIKFVCVPEKADKVSLTYGIYDKDTKTVGKTTTVSLTGRSDGSFISDDIYFRDAETIVAYYYTVDGVKTLDTTAKETVKAGDDEYSAYTKAEFKGRPVSLPGTVNGNGWDPAKESEQMTYQGNGIYSVTIKNVGAGSYQYKIGINKSWDENYGAKGEEHGTNIDLTVPKTTDITFTYNDISHMVVNSIDYIFADVALTGTGIPEGTKLEDTLLKGIYSTSVSLKAGDYKDIKYTYDGKEYPVSEFSLKKDKEVSFYFDPATEISYNDASDEKVDTSNIYYDSKDTMYKDPYGAIEQGKDVTFSIQTGADAKEVKLVVKGKEKTTIKLDKKGDEKDGKQMWSVTTSFKSIGEYHYFFVVSNGSSISVYSDDSKMDYGVGTATELTSAVPYDFIVYKSGYKTPDWMKNAVIYQIFPDRFFDGDISNNQAQTTARGALKYEYVTDWSLYPENPEQEALAKEDKTHTYPKEAYKGDGQYSNEIYGGDLKGITKRISYLKALGVNVIYLNPIFTSISNHRYDASDYKTIDPILGDLGDFTELVKVAKKNDMHIILDGVFNHVADDSKYFDRYYRFLKKGTTKIGAYPYWAYVYDLMKADKKLTKSKAEAKAKKYFKDKYGIKDFTYTKWFQINNTYMKDSNGKAVKDTVGLRKGKGVYSYDCWWGYDNMPVILSTNGSEYQTPGWKEEIIGTQEKSAKDDGSVTKYWLEKGSNGWRLDVANEVSDETWQHFRKSVKALNEDNVIIGEIWSDAANYLLGDMYDSVMNYVFRNAVISFVRDGDLTKAVNTLERLRERYPKEAFYAMMNLVASHDTTRILSYLDGIDDDKTQKDTDSAFPTYEKTSDRAKNLQYVVAFIQMTYPGAPTIYYGDEIGMVGADDPDDRRGMTWGQGNKEIVEWYATMAKIRSEYTALRTGDINMVSVNDNVLAYTRSDKDASLLVMSNNSDKEIKANIDFKGNGLADGTYKNLVNGTEYEVKDGAAEVAIPAYRGTVLVAKDKAKSITIDAEALKPAYDKKYVVDKRVAKPAKVTLKSVKNTKSKSISVSWKKVSGAKGYQITYSTSKKFSKKLTKTITVASSASSKVIKNLKKNKTYYVKVRAFKKDKKGNKVYGSYSSVKKVAVKK